MSQDGSWIDIGAANKRVAAPFPVELQVALEHEMEFHFDASGHVTKVVCSCGAEGTVQML